jgi:multidrug efflux pump subunit AcrA (membrane-fusion protein)
MLEVDTLLPIRRNDLVVRPLGDQGRYVVKDPCTGAYFHIGNEEHFLLTRLDGQRSAAELRAEFGDSFEQPLSDEDLDDFLRMALACGFLQSAGTRAAVTEVNDAKPPGCHAFAANGQSHSTSSHVPPRKHATRQSLLAWRWSLFDPDRLFNWLEPRLRFLWTPGFLILSMGCILAAAVLVWTNAQELVSHFSQSLRWQTLVLAWLTLFIVGTLHEFAHGLTCKHYGGEVHEVGFLMLLLMPCFYCNVSDAWLFREKSKRLWVSLSGGYFELFLWALAVFVWRLTVSDNLVNYLAFIVLSVCGLQTLFNFNPLVKLDGYYLLSDWLEIPNLQQRAWGYLKAQLRWLLWGAARPDAHDGHRPGKRHFLLVFGLVSWLFSLVFLILTLVALMQYLSTPWGVVGLVVAGLLGFMTLRGLLRGFLGGEVRKMIFMRHKRTAAWLMFSGVVPALLFLVQMEDRASGPFQLRSASRAELRAPIAGFVREIYFDEGDRVSPGTVVARLEVPDLASRQAQKRAEVGEAQTRLSLLEAGPRYEELDQQRLRVERMKTWRDLAHKDLEHARQALQEELARLSQLIDQNRAELDAARDAYERAKSLRSKGASAQEQFEEAKRKHNVAQAALAQAQSQKRQRQALGTREALAGLDAEAELARREKDLADAQATLTLLEAGTRPEEIEAGRAHLARLAEEARYLDSLTGKLHVNSPVAGVIVTAHLKEKVGQYVREGELICQVEEPALLEAEIAIPEQEAARVQPGQPVELKARALPFHTFTTQVDRIAPAAVQGEVQSSVTVFCRLPDPGSALRPGMTGHARINAGQRPLGLIMIDRTLRFLRTEFWW